MTNWTKPRYGSSFTHQYLTSSILADDKGVTIVLTPIRSREHPSIT
jgi:hypothetical protein